MKMRLAATVAAAMLSAGVAQSADLYQAQPAPLLDAPEVTVQEASGWYLRGDVGYLFNKMRGAKYFQGGQTFETDFTSADLDDSWMFGAGVGYQINNYLRTDLTFDRLTSADFRGSTTGLCLDGVTFCTSSDKASMSAYSLMANVYVDLGTYSYFTPYVGAGLGATYVKWGKLRNQICDDPGAPGCYGDDHEGKSGWRASAALMAGTTIDITCNLKADVGYRYRYIDGGNMFGFAGGGGAQGRDKGFHSHEARVGARYMFNNACDAPAYEPAPEPIVYK